MQLPLFEPNLPKGVKKPARAAARQPATTSQTYWQTPQHILDRAVEVLGAVDLNPCSNSNHSPEVAAKVSYTLEENGLARPWNGRVWLHPPSGRVINKWIDKLCAEYETGGVTAAVALLPSRTDTQWWQRIATYPICFIRGRLHFVGQKSPANYASAVVYLGPLLSRFTGAFGSIGVIYSPYGVSDLPPSPIWPSRS
ncbi:MAG: hypothetical protein IT324_03095 [Anaerolineae bacterium]|nr:hypothetical protein [Anaerolineae bacterium]